MTTWEKAMNYKQGPLAHAASGTESAGRLDLEAAHPADADRSDARELTREAGAAEFDRQSEPDPLKQQWLRRLW
jgi:hypothetical protein